MFQLIQPATDNEFLPKREKLIFSRWEMRIFTFTSQNTKTIDLIHSHISWRIMSYFCGLECMCVYCVINDGCSLYFRWGWICAKGWNPWAIGRKSPQSPWWFSFLLEASIPVTSFLISSWGDSRRIRCKFVPHLRPLNISFHWKFHIRENFHMWTLWIRYQSFHSKK